METIIETEFVPSTDWQEVPAGIVLPNGGEYRMNLETGKNTVRWSEPVPGAFQDELEEDDGLPPIVSMRDFVNQPIPPCVVDADLEDDDDECDESEVNAWTEYRNAVQEHWKDDLRKEYEAKFEAFKAEVIQGKKEKEKPQRRSLPDIVSWSSITADENIVQPKQIIHGVLYKGCKLVFGGPSKAKKSWVLMDLAWAVANGEKWMNFLQCSQGNVLYINFELIPFDTKFRGNILTDNHPDQLKHVDMWNLRGYAEDIEMLSHASHRAFS